MKPGTNVKRRANPTELLLPKHGRVISSQGGDITVQWSDGSEETVLATKLREQ